MANIKVTSVLGVKYVPRETFYMKQQHKKGEKNRVGAYGEEIAARYLTKLGFSIIERNYLEKWGEIDIVARETTGKLHFIEVKAVSYETRQLLEGAVSRGTWRPEENVHRDKIMRMSRTIETWIGKHRDESEWQIDIVAVRVVPREKYATVKYLPNIIME